MHLKNFASSKLYIFVFILVFVFISAFIPEPGINDNKIDLIMIDAGHGGSDPGNLGTKRYKTTEKDITLKVALKLGKYIEERIPGVEVIYSRKDDSYPTLKQRTEKANKKKVDLFISIHCDSFHKESAHGCGTYVIGPAKTNANLKMAQRENASMLKEKDYQKIYGGFDPYSPESYIELSLRQNAFIDQSLNFSDKVQRQFRDRVGRVDRGVRQAPYWVISFTTMPSVLIELGFLTNKKEEDFLITDRGQDLMASAIFRAFRSYKGEIEGIEVDQTIQQESIFVTKEESSESLNSKKTEDRNSAVVDKFSSRTKGLCYKVQLMTSSKDLSQSVSKFDPFAKVEMLEDKGLYKYFTGSEKSYDAAKDIQIKASNSGFEGAFIVAFENGERISLQEALLRADKD
ncbi:MAG: N-acetylmuramoyl-L-alanine amidase [Bacteroidota bacterium]